MVPCIPPPRPPGGGTGVGGVFFAATTAIAAVSGVGVQWVDSPGGEEMRHPVNGSGGCLSESSDDRAVVSREQERARRRRWHPPYVTASANEPLGACVVGARPVDRGGPHGIAIGTGRRKPATAGREGGAPRARPTQSAVYIDGLGQLGLQRRAPRWS